MTPDGSDVDAVEARTCEAWVPSGGIGARSPEKAGRRVSGVIVDEWRVERRPAALVPVIVPPAQETVELLLDPPQD
jgi:hypothetical protein